MQISGGVFWSLATRTRNTYKSSYPTRSKQAAGVYQADSIPIHHAKRQKDGAHHNLNDRDDFKESSVMSHFTVRRSDWKKYRAEFWNSAYNTEGPYKRRLWLVFAYEISAVENHRAYCITAFGWLDWTGLDWTGLVKRRLVKRGLHFFKDFVFKRY